MTANGESEPGGTEDADAWFAGVLERFEAPLLRYAASLAGTAAAPDIVQDTFLALCSAERAKLVGHLRPWLFLVCKRLALDVLRRRQRLTSLDDTIELERAEPADANAGIERVDAADAASKLVDALPERQRQVVILRFAGGLSYKQIAELTDLGVSHVGVLLHTALASLRERSAEPPETAAEGARDEHAP